MNSELAAARLEACCSCVQMYVCRGCSACMQNNGTEQLQRHKNNNNGAKANSIEG